MTEGQERARIVARLKRIEGQVAGIRRMVEDDKYCVDTLLQVSAVHGALSKVGQIILSQHIETCVTSAFASGDESKRQETIEELLDVFARYGGAGG
jgi:CsoR family transcriptional regulator, copper-sensing transcriptional repressor